MMTSYKSLVCFKLQPCSSANRILVPAPLTEWHAYGYAPS